MDNTIERATIISTTTSLLVAGFIQMEWFLFLLAGMAFLLGSSLVYKNKMTKSELFIPVLVGLVIGLSVRFFVFGNF